MSKYICILAYLFTKFSSQNIFLTQLDVASSQLLVTDNDFRDSDFRRQLTETVNSLLALKVIPVFNENDAISTRKAPYEVCSMPTFYILVQACVYFVYLFLEEQMLSCNAFSEPFLLVPCYFCDIKLNGFMSPSSCVYDST